MLRTHLATLDAIIDAHAADLGADAEPYRNHTYRVANLCMAFAGDAADVTKIEIAAAFHDLGIWTDHTFDYLEPSVAQAEAYLARSGRSDLASEIAMIIRMHHKVTRHRGEPGWLVEPFRKADWVDVTRGLLRFGLPRSMIRALYSQWPSAGFHKRLLQLEFGHLRRHPLNPLPVFKL
jgi:hypothetical protein